MTTAIKTTTTTTKGGAKKTMKDGIRRPRGPGGKWGYVIDLKLQPAQRCRNAECEYLAQNPRSAGFRHWMLGFKLDACPHCGEPLRETQERRLVTHGGFDKEEEAKQARDMERAKYHKGEAQPPLRMTVAHYLGVWLETLEERDIKQSTRESYRDHVPRHLIGPPSRPFPLATTQLRDLRLKAIKQHYEMLAAGYDDWTVKRDPKTRRKVIGADGRPEMEIVHRPGLGVASIRRVHATLHRALNAAIEQNLLGKNPAQGAAETAPKKAREKPTRGIQFWSQNELQRFLDFAEGLDGVRGDLYPLWYLMSHTGIRRGEAAGLRWEDFDAEAGTLKIRRNRVPLKNGVVEETTPKTKGSIRTLALGVLTTAMLDKRQRTAQTRAHLAAGPRWQETGYIFTDAAGAPLHPNAITWQFRTTRTLANLDAANPATPKALELSPLSVHGLRHTFASIALQEGVPVTVVSKYLGHASVTMTFDVYSHAVQGAQQELADTFEAAVDGAF